MGTSGDGNGLPDNSGPSEPLTGLPPDWGTIILPDDPAELADEAAQVRRELRRQHRRWHRTPVASPGWRGSSASTTFLIMSLAVLAALAGLLAIIWPGQQRGGGRATPAATGRDYPDRSLPALDLVGDNGAPVSLRGLLPAVIVLTDGCDCVEQLTWAARTVPAGVTVVAVSSGRPTPDTTIGQAGGGAIRSLADPAAELRDALAPPPPRPGTTVLVDRTGRIIQILPEISALAGHSDELARIAAAG